MSPPPGPLFYRGARGTFRVIALAAFRFRVEGVEHVPRLGPVVIVAHHRSWLDPACVGAACPRPVRFLIREDVYGKPWGSWFYRRMGTMPVRLGGARSIGALRSALRALASGELVGVFPEGRVVRDGEAAELHAGAALLAVHGSAPIVPVHIEGSALAWPHGRRYPRPAAVRVKFGPPLSPPAERGRMSVSELSAGMRLALERLAANGR